MKKRIVRERERERERERARERERERVCSTSKCGRVSGVAGKAVGVGWDVVGQRKGRGGRVFYI
jgi:hypothetical protein